MTTWGHSQIAQAADAGLAAVLARTDTHAGLSLGDAYLGRSTTDVLAHLHAWQVLCEGWIDAARLGGEVHYPAQGYSWNELESLNESLYGAHAGRSYDAVREALIESHRLLLALVRATPESLLADPAAHPWLGGEPLGMVAHECLGAHYDWALGILSAAGVAGQA